MSELSLKKLVVPSKETWADVSGFEGFKVKVRYLSRDEVMKIREKCSIQKIDRKTRQVEKEVDPDLFQEVYIKSVLVDWEGLKLKYLDKLLAVDLSGVEDLEDTLNFTEENAIELMKNSSIVDTFVSNMLEEVENFSKSSKAD
jgi:hypothetical protein